MNDQSRFIEDLKDSTSYVRHDDLDPSSTRAERAQTIENTARHLDEHLLSVAERVLPSLEAAERRHVLDGLQDIALQVVAAQSNVGQVADAQALLSKVLKVIPADAARPTIQAAKTELEVFGKAVAAVWLERKGYSSDAVRLAKEVRKATTSPVLLGLVKHIKVPSARRELPQDAVHRGGIHTHLAAAAVPGTRRARRWLVFFWPRRR